MGVAEIPATPIMLFMLLVHKILQGDGFKKIVNHCVQLFPHRKRAAAGGAGAGGGTLGSTRYRGESAFCQFENAANSIFRRFPVQPIAAAFSMDCIHKAGFGKDSHNGFQIFLGNILFFSNLLQRDKFAAAVESKADHHP